MKVCVSIPSTEAAGTSQVVRKTESLVDQKYLRDG